MYPFSSIQTLLHQMIQPISALGKDAQQKIRASHDHTSNQEAPYQDTSKPKEKWQVAQPQKRFFSDQKSAIAWKRNPAHHRRHHHHRSDNQRTSKSRETKLPKHKNPMSSTWKT